MRIVPSQIKKNRMPPGGKISPQNAIRLNTQILSTPTQYGGNPDRFRTHLRNPRFPKFPAARWIGPAEFRKTGIGNLLGWIPAGIIIGEFFPVGRIRSGKKFLHGNSRNRISMVPGLAPLPRPARGIGTCAPARRSRKLLASAFAKQKKGRSKMNLAPRHKQSIAPMQDFRTKQMIAGAYILFIALKMIMFQIAAHRPAPKQFSIQIQIVTAVRTHEKTQNRRRLQMESPAEQRIFRRPPPPKPGTISRKVSADQS